MFPEKKGGHDCTFFLSKNPFIVSEIDPKFDKTISPKIHI
jgi:hypothetical protein